MKRFNFILLFVLLAMSPSFAQLEHCKEILAIRITGAKGSSEVTCDENRGAGYKAFGGYCDNDYFKGVILPGGYDNMKKRMVKNTLCPLYVGGQRLLWR